MEKLKKRIKRALAGFLREELLEYIGYNHEIPYMSLNDRFKVKNVHLGKIETVHFETIVLETIIPIEIDERKGYSKGYSIEELIDNCKRDFAEQIMKHIHVDAQNLTTREDFMNRSVRFVLRVQSQR